MLKKKVINILIGFTVFLLLVNLIVENFSHKEPEKAKSGFSVSESENRFFKTLNNYGILQEWIKVVKKNYPEDDSLAHYIVVDIPTGVVLPQFIYDFKKSFPDSVHIITEEQEKHGSTLLSVSSGNIVLLRTVLKYNKNIFRPYCSFSFCVMPPEDREERGIEEFIKNPYPCSLCDVPSFSNLEYKKEFAGNNKEFVLLINDEIKDNRFKLSGENSRQRLKGSVESIARTFGEDSYLLVDDNSEVFKSTSYDFIKNEFARKNIKLNPLSGLKDLRSKSKEEIQSLLKFYSSSASYNESVSLLFNYDDFISLEEFIKQFKRKGHRINSLSNTTVLPDSTI
ncbi:MAG: hypothetical protein KKA84_09960 [Bacteroidetes bacterium]|nr:hypothetical protein [Bacteroidota bacterium]